jgi:putative transposase
VSLEAVERLAEEFPVAAVCNALGRSRSAVYAARARKEAGPSRQDRARQHIRHVIKAVFEENRGVSGRPRMRRALAAKGIGISVNRLRREMAQMGLYGKIRRKFKTTTLSDGVSRIAPNLLKQKFKATAPDRVWCGDITYVRTWEGWLYVAVVIDLFSRKVVGWSVADHMRVDLVTDAFDLAVSRRNVQPGLIFHSDRGSQYASNAMRRRLKRLKAKQSMSRKGDCYDNAVVESFNDKLKQELIHRASWPTKAKAKLAIVEYIERFYNATRMHSTLDYLSPNQFEQHHVAAEAAA